MLPTKQPRSFIFDVPSSGDAHLPPINSHRPKINHKALISPVSKGSTSESSPSHDLNTTLLTEESERQHSAFLMRYLPYIYAQSGSTSVRNIMKIEGKCRDFDSLPLMRKVKSIDLLPKEKIFNPTNELIRVKSMEVIKTSSVRQE